ncbi:P-loop containing nucleoside triphosphate hydrolase protein [Venturia nashicola]|nr:P-loop containing nucleoside triphosphate hydrolase protein [Venturia nashicola]
MLDQLSGLVGLQLASAFAGGSTGSTGPNTPHILLDRYIPGFGAIHGLILARTGIDITSIVARCAVVLGVYTVSKFIWNRAYDFLIEYVTSAITIPAHDALNKEVLSWMSSHVVVKRGSRHLSAQTVRSGDDAILDPYRSPGYQMTAVLNSQTSRSSSVRFYPAVGIHYFLFQGRPFVFELAGEATKNRYEGETGQNPIILRCLGRSPEPLKRFLVACKEFGRDARDSMTVVCTAEERSPSRWGRMITRPTRPLKTVDMEETMKDSLIKDIERYLDPSTRKFYSNRGIPYRRGYLFYGAPGTGKTSLSFALAGHFKLNLYIMSLASPKMDDAMLDTMFGMLPPQCIVLMEDIDSARIERGTKQPDEEDKNAKKKLGRNNGPVTLSGLLNAIDGSASQEGRVLIMTSNSPEQLDDALLRPGRIDKQLCFPASSSAMAARLFVRMFTKDAGDISEDTVSGNKENIVVGDMDTATIASMAETFAAKIPGEKLTPAEVQGFLLDYRSSPQDAIAKVDTWVKVMTEAKEKGTAVLDHFKAAVPSATPSEEDPFDMMNSGDPFPKLDYDDPLIQDMIRDIPPHILSMMPKRVEESDGEDGED